MPSRKPPETKFGKWLDKQLDVREWSFRDLAKRASMHHGTISHWRRVKEGRSLKYLWRIALALEMPFLEVWAASLEDQDPEWAAEVRAASRASKRSALSGKEAKRLEMFYSILDLLEEEYLKDQLMDEIARRAQQLLNEHEKGLISE